MTPVFCLASRHVQRLLAAQTLDALLLTDIVNIGYVSGFTGSTAFVLVTPDEALLITDGRYTLRARQECPHSTSWKPSGSGGYPEKLAEALNARPAIRRLGFEAGKVTVAQWQQFQKENRPTWNGSARRSLSKGCAWSKTRGKSPPSAAPSPSPKPPLRQSSRCSGPASTEREVALELEFAMRRAGADDRAFETIVASGAQGAHPHHRPNDRPFVSGRLGDD